MFGVVQHTHAAAHGPRQRLHEGVDRPRALPFEAECLAMERGPGRKLDPAGAFTQTVLRRRHLLQAVFTLEQGMKIGRGQLLAANVHLVLHHLTELDLQTTRQLQPILAFEQIGDAALARLAVDADHGLIAAAQVLGIDRQIGHVPDIVLPARREGLLDRILVRTRERGVDQIADIGVTGMHGQLVAVFDRAANGVDIREIEARIHALDVHIERDVDDVEIARALAIAEQAALEAVGAGHQGQLGRGRARAAVVVRMHRDHDAVAARDVAAGPLDHVGEDVRRRMLHRGRQIDDALALGRGLPDFGHGVDHAQRKFEFGVRIHLGRILEGPCSRGLLGGELLEQAGIARGELDYLVLAHVQHHTAHHGCRGVVEVDDGTRHALQGLEGATDQMLARLGQHLDGDILGDQILLDELADEVELDLGSRRKADLDLLEADLHELVEHAHLALYVHGLDQGLIAVAQIHAAPHRRLGNHGIGPGPVLQAHGGKRTIFGGGVLQHGHELSVVDSKMPICPATPRTQNGPSLLQTGR